MKKTLLILFVLVPLIAAVSVFALPNKAFSEKENRNLTNVGDVSFNIKDGAFQSSLENLISDQFPLRESLVYLQSALRYATGSREIGGAYFCEDGRLMQKITDEDIDENALFSYADNINRLAKEYRTFVMYVPSAGSVNGDSLPAGAPMYDYKTLYKKLAKRLSCADCIDLSEYLNRPDYYYKTDHHWNAYGAYGAYTAFCRAKGEEARKTEEFALKRVTSDFRGTLYSKVLISKEKDEILLPDVSLPQITADGEKVDFYDYKALKTKDKYNVFQGGNHGITEITANGKNNKTLLVFKDSFANSFVPYIAGDYRKIILVDQRYTFISAKDFADKIKPDEILVLREITG